MNKYLNQNEIIQKFLLENIKIHPSDIVSMATKEFKVTRTTIQRHLKTLLKNGKILKSGDRNKIKYFYPNSLTKYLDFKITSNISEFSIWDQNFKHLQSVFTSNLYDICIYGFTEIFNNAIDHSQGTSIQVQTKEENKKFSIEIADNGIGIFEKIKNSFGFQDEKESILHLSKGKLTTDPKRHSGEGIFFVSKVFDTVTIYSNGLCYLRDNKENDWMIERKQSKNSLGTTVSMSIDLDSNRNLKELFNKYTNPKDFTFDKTDIMIDLSLSDEDQFVSRSQARKILFGLNKFKHIVLDFSKIKTVGQAFVDEVFRVFQKQHPEVKIEVIHANEEVDFMIKRGLNCPSLELR